MSDEPKKRSRRWVCWTIALLILYPVSIGPASWLCAHSDSQWAAPIYHTTYMPIDLARTLSPTVDKAFIWYEKLWLPAP
jgi:hypothetical protein